MKLKEQDEKLLGLSVLFLLVGMIIVFIATISIFAALQSQTAGEEASASADGFTIERYHVILDVDESCSIQVTEELTVDFYEEGHHGIFRYIPFWLKYTAQDGEAESRKSKIDDLVCRGEKYSVDITNKKERIRIGDANKTLPIGPHTYQISYTYDMGKDPYAGFDELIFHAYGDFWGTRINNASIEVRLPKQTQIDGCLHFFADKYREKEITSYVDYTVSGNTVYAEVSPEYCLNRSLTFDLELPENYFRNRATNYGYGGLTLCLICILSAVAAFVLWCIFGKDLVYPRTVEFYPPEGMDAAQIGYLYKGSGGKRLSVALLLALVRKGYYQISYKKKDGYHLIRTKETVSKMALSKNEELLNEQLAKRDGKDWNLKAINRDLSDVSNGIEQNLNEEFAAKSIDLRARICQLITSICFVNSVILWLIAYCGLEDLNPRFDSFYPLAAIAVFGTFVLAILMDRRTPYREKLQARIEGFKNYLEIAEKNQIEMLAEENPNYFYDILPYAYVLGVSQKWAEKFDVIPEPAAHMGDFDFGHPDYLDRVFYSSSESGSSRSSSSGSSSSSCGGGCSSCGGGCSSCGGGGSW